MAVAVKFKMFVDPADLAKFCATAGNNVTTIISIVFDSNRNVHIVYYT